MSRIPQLIDTIMRLKRKTQASVAESSGLHRSNLSRFLSGEIDIRLSSLDAILQTLDIRLEDFLQQEVSRLIGKSGQTDTLGEALEVLFRRADPITARTMIESLAVRSKQRDAEVLDALNVINSYKSKLRIVRGAQ